MKKALWILFIVFAITVTACTQSATPVAIPTVSLDSGSQSPIFSSVATASGTVVPVQSAKLGFPIAGVVKTVEVAAGDSVKVDQPLVTLDASILQARVDQAAADILTNEAQVAYLVRVGTSQENLDSAKADVDRAKAAVEVAKAQLAQATLTAPFDGVIASVDIEMSEYVTPGQVIITLGDFSHFRIETTDLSEKDVPLVQIGQTAKVYIDALNKEFTGKVVDIARISETVGGDVVYKVKIELEEQPDGLRWGMSVDVKIETK